MQCCLWFHSVIRVRGPWPKHYGYHLSNIIIIIIIITIYNYNNKIVSIIIIIITTIMVLVNKCNN